MDHEFFREHSRRARRIAPLLLTLLLAACGDQSTGSADAAAATTGDVAATQTLNLDVTLPDVDVNIDAADAVPTFHTAPVLLEDPAEDDVYDPTASAALQPHTQYVPVEFDGISSRGLTRAALMAGPGAGDGTAPLRNDASDATPFASGAAVVTYTPAQIRAAYALPALPVAGAALSSSQAAQLGAGQTIYLIDAQDDPNAAAELARFNQQFGLPTCTSVSIAVNASLPLATAPLGGCTFSVVHSNASGAMTAAAPAYDSGWATESALDVQWSHATAPLARIILIEAPDASINSLLGAVNLANAMGPGIVSMSFGTAEGSWTASVDSAFARAGMTYVASAGDSGAGVSWPAVSPRVVAVGGTSLTWSGSGTRSETVWSGTGGGVSAYTPTPAYQSNAVPGMGAPAHRAVTDVSFNADPATGQYLAVQSPGSATVNWLSAGGTSVSAPQWAGVFAVTNALLVQRGQSLLGAPHASLYGRVASVAATYGSAFADITRGSDGSCAACAAKVGYDLPTGLGSPTASGLLPVLTGTAAIAPVVGSASVSGVVGTPLSFVVAVTSADPLAYTLSGAPAGMTIASTGTVSWNAPVAGTYAVTVNVVDKLTGLAGQGVYTVSIAAPQPPVVPAASVTGSVGTALSYAASVTHANAVSLSLVGAPAGMTVSSAAVVAWPTPVAGSYKVTLVARDTTTGLSGQGVLTVTISPPQPPVVTAATINGTTAAALAFTVTATAAHPLNYSLTGAPAGMAIGSTGQVTWAHPVAGRYAVTVGAIDTKTGLSGTGLYTVVITPAGPVLSATAMTGVAGKALSGSIGFSDATSSSLSLTVSGVPMGMTLAASAGAITVKWSSPVTGSYTLNVVARDGNGLSATLAVPVTITAH